MRDVLSALIAQALWFATSTALLMVTIGVLHANGVPFPALGFGPCLLVVLTFYVVAATNRPFGGDS